MHFHKWTKWEIIDKGQVIMNGGGDNDVIGKFIIQQRRCEKCGLSQIKEQRT